MPPTAPAADTPAKQDREPLDGWRTLGRFLPYLWPADAPALKRRIVGAMGFVLLAKATALALPYVYKRAVDVIAADLQRLRRTLDQCVQLTSWRLPPLADACKREIEVELFLLRHRAPSSELGYGRREGAIWS